ncbi:hypothetical protein KCU84_g6439, partial [Aureobasidium melanogenum]
MAERKGAYGGAPASDTSFRKTWDREEYAQKAAEREQRIKDEGKARYEAAAAGKKFHRRASTPPDARDTEARKARLDVSAQIGKTIPRAGAIMDDSMAESDFAIDASSDFELPKKAPAKKAPAKKAAAAPKPKAAPKKQTTLKTTKTTKTTAKKPPTPVSDDENSDADVHFNNDDDDSLLADTPPKKAAPKKAPAKKAAAKPLQEIDNESFAAEGAEMDASDNDKMVQPKPKKGSATSQYQKLTQLEHIIKRPDTYIGSVERLEKQMWVYNSENEAIESREISYVPGLYKIFDEILVNAADNKQR